MTGSQPVNMKTALFLQVILLSTINIFSQVTITVDAGNILKKLSGIENGININYLMDGSYLSADISPQQSIKNSKAKLLRYPGGEKADNYLFSAAPYNSASPRMALKDTCFWPANDARFVDTTSAEKLCKPVVLDFDEFMTICTNTGATPLIVVAYDAAYNTRACEGKPTKSELITNAVEWVRYANVKHNWKVKYWMIGNESWNSPVYNGRVTPSQYAVDVADFANAMKAVDPSIKIIANGKSEWWQTLLESSAVSKIDYFALSEYPVASYTGGYDYYRNNDVDLAGEIDQAIYDINNFAPATHRSRIKVIAAEYNSIDWSNEWVSSNDVGHALVNFQMFGDIISKPQVEAACLWNTRWVDNATVQQSLYDAFDKEGNENATGKIVQLWGDNLLSSIVEVSGGSSAIKSYASYDSAGKKLNILLLNKDITSKTVSIQLKDYLDEFNGAVWRFGGTSVTDRFPAYHMVDTVMNSGDLSSVVLPPTSVTAIQLHHKTVAPIEPPVLLQPNPFAERLQVKLFSDDNRLVYVNVYDFLGRKVHYETRKLSQGMNDMDFSRLSLLRSGMYVIHFGGDSFAKTVKVVRR